MALLDHCFAYSFIDPRSRCNLLLV